MKSITCVADLDGDDRFMLVSNSQDIIPVLEYIGCCQGVIDSYPYGCLFVEVLGGEYGKVYGCESIVPCLDSPLDCLNEQWVNEANAEDEGEKSDD